MFFFLLIFDVFLSWRMYINYIGWYPASIYFRISISPQGIHLADVCHADNIPTVYTFIAAEFNKLLTNTILSVGKMLNAIPFFLSFCIYDTILSRPPPPNLPLCVMQTTSGMGSQLLNINQTVTIRFIFSSFIQPMSEQFNPLSWKYFFIEVI